MSKANIIAVDKDTNRLVARAEYDPLTRRAVTRYPDGRIENGFTGPFANAVWFAAEQVNNDKVLSQSIQDDMEDILRHFPTEFRQFRFFIRISDPVKYRLATMRAKYSSDS